jgi:hypothetical protein
MISVRPEISLPVIHWYQSGFQRFVREVSVNPLTSYHSMNIKSIVILIFILPISIFCQIDRTRSWYFGEGLKIFFYKGQSIEC